MFKTKASLLRSLLLFSATAFLLLSSCTSKNQELGASADSVSNDRAARFQNAQSELDVQIKEMDQTIKNYRLVVNLIKVLLHTPEDVDPLELLLSVHHDAKEAWPVMDHNMNLMIAGSLTVENFGHTSQCHKIDYMLTSRKGFLTYDFKTCYSADWIPLLEFQTSGRAQLKIHLKNLGQLVPIRDAIQTASGCELSASTHHRLQCRDILLMSDSTTQTYIDLDERETSYRISAKIVDRDNQSIVRKGQATLSKTGEIREFVWQDR